MTNMSEEKEQLKKKEEWLREELRHTRMMWLNLLKWGVTVLAALESSLYFVRRDVTEHLIAAGALPIGGLMPWPRWFLGTLFLAFIAYVFALLTVYIGKKHTGYREQLVSMKPSYSEIKEIPVGTKLKNAPYYLFYAFPVIDQLLYLTFSISKSFKIPW
jgi:hypothetical protein